MIRKLTKLINLNTITPKHSLLNIPKYNLQHRMRWNFSQKKDSAQQFNLPKDKQQAWRKQQLKRLRSKPQEKSQLQGESSQPVSIFSMAVVVVTAAALIGIAFYFNYNKVIVEKYDKSVSGYTEQIDEQSVIGGDWTLIDQHGRSLSSANLNGYYYLITFGFTKSLDACPSLLLMLSSVYRIIRNMPDGTYLKFKILFVTIDPERDTPQVLKKYLIDFDSKMIGLTSQSSEDPDLKRLLKSFKVNAQKVPITEGVKKGSYLFNHSTRIFLMNPDNKYLDYLDVSQSEHHIARRLMKKITKDKNQRERLKKE